MTLTPLSAISPIDGRYRNTTAKLADYFSEYALIKYRVFVEIEYFIALYEHPLPQLHDFDKTVSEKLRAIFQNFSEKDAESIKEIEKITNHDVKAVEYFIKKEFDKLGLEKYKEFIHFGLTSQDINNTSIPYSFKLAVEETWSPAVNELIAILKKYAADWEKLPMLAHTHGQPASPTRLGKEIMVFVERLENQMILFKQIPYSAKFGGATGNFNAHHIAYPQVDWKRFGNHF
ncbi:MAG: lyase family protein, partial [Mucilaginibacter sp.]